MEGDRSSLAALVNKSIWAGFNSEARNGATVKVAVSLVHRASDRGWA